MVCLKVCSKAASITQLVDNLGQRFSVRDTSNSDLLRWKTTAGDLKSIKTWRSIRWGGALDVQENKISSLWLPWAPSTVQTEANLQAEISGSHALNMITEFVSRSSSFNLSITWPSLICSRYLCCKWFKINTMAPFDWILRHDAMWQTQRMPEICIWISKQAVIYSYATPVSTFYLHAISVY